MAITDHCAVNLKKGLHARTSAELMGICSRFDADIQLQTESGIAKANSILQVLSLCITNGTNVTVTATGNEAKEAKDAVIKFLTSHSNH